MVKAAMTRVQLPLYNRLRYPDNGCLEVKPLKKNTATIYRRKPLSEAHRMQIVAKRFRYFGAAGFIADEYYYLIMNTSKTLRHIIAEAARRT